MFVPQEQPSVIATSRRNVTIGVPASESEAERRYPITPEAAGMLTDRGFTVRIETGAADSIHYTDTQYIQAGASVTTRQEALKSDIVLHLAPIARADARQLQRGALLLTLFHQSAQDPAALCTLLERGITSIALDLITDNRGNMPFADILAEIDGRASIAIASSLLADASRGKGILIGGIAGIVPREVTVIGSGIAALAAARSSLGLGAMVRMFDNDVYRLRGAIRELGSAVTGSAIIPHVLLGALRSADIVVATPLKTPHILSSDIAREMKRGVITFDLAHSTCPTFPWMPTIDLASATPADNDMACNRRTCYINAGNAVPRTAAMALSNAFITMLGDITAAEGVTNALKIMPGLRNAVYTFMGHPVNRTTAQTLSMRYVDINFFLQLS